MANHEHSDKDKAIRARMQKLLDELDYDFHGFTLQSFTTWLEQRRGRKIEYHRRAMLSPRLHGSWLAGEDRDFVFYEANTIPIHQLHICLHELGHMICGHSTVTIGRDATPSDLEHVLLRSFHSDEEEKEAEALTELIQNRILRYHKLDELVAGTATDEDLASYLRAMEV
jgi:Zn-dependent peptidase ImmA (M78 family)